MTYPRHCERSEAIHFFTGRRVEKSQGVRKESKNFFFEKKKQKTFANLGHSFFHQHGLNCQKFFGYFFSKK